MNFKASPFITGVIFLAVAGFSQAAFAADAPINRHDGFLLIWRSISRPAEKTNEKPYADVPKTDPGYAEITYAKARGILNDENANFRPNEPLSSTDAMLILFRTRSVERLKENGDIDFMALPNAPDVPALAAKYGISYDAEGSSLTQENLLTLMRELDAALQKEEHEVSLYSEKFHGKGTAFGETFDMYALTAAHRSFPANTLVRVTNVANGKSVVVRINDRGPFVQGRNMDLSLGAFTTIAARSSGKIQATFERLGDSTLVHSCSDDRLQRRITRNVRLNLGIPHSFALGKTLTLTSDEFFVVRDVYYPDGVSAGTQEWVGPGSGYTLMPATTGRYRFLMGTKAGNVREMVMDVVDCAQ